MPSHSYYLIPSTAESTRQERDSSRQRVQARDWHHRDVCPTFLLLSLPITWKRFPWGSSFFFLSWSSSLIPDKTSFWVPQNLLLSLERWISFPRVARSSFSPFEINDKFQIANPTLLSTAGSSSFLIITSGWFAGSLFSSIAVDTGSKFVPCSTDKERWGSGMKKAQRHKD